MDPKIRIIIITIRKEITIFNPPMCQEMRKYQIWIIP